jgi:hypothetical protein
VPDAKNDPKVINCVAPNFFCIYSKPVYVYTSLAMFTKNQYPECVVYKKNPKKKNAGPPIRANK